MTLLMLFKKFTTHGRLPVNNLYIWRKVGLILTACVLSMSAHVLKYYRDCLHTRTGTLTPRNAQESSRVNSTVCSPGKMGAGNTPKGCSDTIGREVFRPF